MVDLWKIFAVFFKMGLFTFGGGYAMLPILKSEVADKYKWVSEEELLNYYSIGQCTPGMIAVNAASFIGYKLRKLSGLIAATMGVIAPSIIIILLLALILRQYMDNQYVQQAFGGIRISVTALIINTVADMWKKGVKRVRDYLVFAVALILLVWCHLSAIVIVLLAAGSAFIPDFGSKKA
ncbi:MAG: chromate transporter [Alphaproteobacteria bacterium]|nr:chromate transporter [Alphaproteobacteria bacterium]MBP1532078.1 chromate transporter [Alphaproteobacteria bacterium]